MPGQQGAAGSPAMIPFWKAGYGGDPARFTMLPSDAVATAGMNIAWQRDKLNQELPAQLANDAANRAVQQQIGMAPWNYKDRVFQTVSPLLTGLLGPGGLAGSGSAGLVGGANTPQPPIDAGPVWTPQQIDQRVNAAKANNAAAASTQQQGVARRTAGQGFGSNSPLAQALSTGIGMGRMGADASAEQDIRWGSAEGNANQLLKGQVAQNTAWRDANQLDIERRKTNNQYVTSLASLLGGLL